MIQQKLPPFLNVNANGIASLRIPNYMMTLNRLVLFLGGTAFTKAMITDIKLKLGTRVVYNITGSRLDAINKYKGIFDHANFLTIDFTERDAPTIEGQELGGYDLSILGDMTVELTIAGATAPTLEASGWFSPRQGNPLIEKLVYLTASTSATGKFAINPQLQGALIKRAYFFYAGTDWTTSANGNMNRLEVKKNGLVIHDMQDLEARFVQQEYRKVPQTRLFVYDPIVNNNASGMVVTADARSLEFNTWLTAADALSVYFELIDQPNNA